MSTAAEFVARESVRATEELEKCLSDFRSVYEGELQAIRELKEQTPKDYEATLHKIFDEFVPKITPPNAQAKALAKGLTERVIEAIDDAMRSEPSLREEEHKLFEKYCTDVHAAVESCFGIIGGRLIERVQQYDASLNSSISSEEIKQAENLLKSRRKEYSKAQSKQRRAIADNIDRAVIENYEKAETLIEKHAQHKQKNTALKHSAFTLPLVFNLIENHDKNLMEISLPILRDEAQEGILKQLDSIIESTCSMLFPEYQRVPGNYTSFRIQGVPIEKVQKALEEKLGAQNEFAAASIQFKYFTTNVKQPPRIETKTEEAPYTINDISRILNITKTRAIDIVHKLLPRKIFEENSIKYGAKKFDPRRFKTSILDVVKPYLNGHAKKSPQIEPAKKQARTENKLDIDENLVPIRKAAEMLRYKTETSIYSNSLLIMKTINRRAYVTRESINQFITQHEIGIGGRYKPRKNSLPENKLANELEKKRDFSLIEHRVFKLLQEGLTTQQIAKKVRKTEKTAQNYIRSIGFYDKSFIKEYYGTLQRIQEEPMTGVRRYPKDDTRAKMLETLVEHLPDKKVHYLGLEGPHFCSYIQLADLLQNQLEPSKSLLAEMDQRSYNIMQSIVQNSDGIAGDEKYKNTDGKIFKGLNIRQGELAEVLESSRTDGFKFNFLNLDYEGHVSANKIYALRQLFGNQMLQDEAILFITLNDSPHLKARLKGDHSLGKEFENGFGTDDQQKIVEAELKKICEHNQYELTRLRAEHYQDRDSRMLTIAYKAQRITK